MTNLETNKVIISFGLDRVRELQYPLFGEPLWEYLSSLIFILLAFAVTKLIDVGLGVWLKRWSERSRFQLADVLRRLIHGPVKVITFAMLIHIGLNVFAWPDWVDFWLSAGLKMAVAGSVCYVAVRFVDILTAYWHQRAKGRTERVFDEQLFPLVNKSIKVFVVVVAVLVTSQNLGLNISSVIASLSIGGLALGLAAQDTLANLFGAVSIFADEPFRIGDRVQFDGVDGTVESIGLRSTRVRNLDGHLITVPNKTMGNATITNVTRRPNIKTVMNIGITYDTPAERVQEAVSILGRIYREHPMTFDVIISFNKFADCALNVLVVHWWNSTDYKAYLDGMQELNLKVKTEFDAAGISFAFPSQTVYLKQDSDWRLMGPADKLEGSKQNINT